MAIRIVVVDGLPAPDPTASTAQVADRPKLAPAAITRLAADLPLLAGLAPRAVDAAALRHQINDRSISATPWGNSPGNAGFSVSSSRVVFTTKTSFSCTPCRG